MLAALAAGGCGAPASHPFDASQTPRTLGPGRAYRPPVSGRPNPCAPTRGVRYGVHLEIFAHGRVVLIPAGIGIAPPLRRQGPYVRAGSCFGAAITREPTGVVEVASGSAALPPSLGAFFSLWGQPLGRRRLAGFAHSDVRAFVDGNPVNSPVAAIPLRAHAEIVLEIGVHVAPHRRYRFAAGL